ncbi:MAG: hypothetical protein KF708_14630 [Pirellulales bacterium]|nr:hypothetical protein [Pirellulales bacterium]
MLHPASNRGLSHLFEVLPLLAPRIRRHPLLWATCVIAGWAVAPVAAQEGEPWVDGFYAPPYACRANFPLAGQEKLFAELRQLQLDVVERLKVPPAPEPVELYLFRDKTTYRDYLAQRFPDVPFRKALYVKGAGPGMVYAYVNGEFEIDVRHESTHALLHAALPMVPLWLDEGLAEYFEVPPADRASANPHFSPTWWAARFGSVPKLTTLEVMQDLGEMGRAEYRHAWAWVHFMLHGPPEAQQELIRYLYDLRQGNPTLLLSERLAARIPDLNQCFCDHFLKWK